MRRLVVFGIGVFRGHGKKDHQSFGSRNSYGVEEGSFAVGRAEKGDLFSKKNAT